MPRLVTVGTLIDRALRLADKEGSTFTGRPEVMDLMLTKYAELYGLLVKSGCQYFESISLLTTTGVASYSLLAGAFWNVAPADFWGLLRLDFLPPGQRPRPIPAAMVQELHFFNPNQSSVYAIRHRIAGNTLYLYPTAPTGQVYQLMYVPAAMATFAAGEATTLDGQNGWEQLLVVEAAIDLKFKDHRDTAYLITERDRLTKWIQQQADEREAANPSRVPAIDPTNAEFDGWGQNFFGY